MTTVAMTPGRLPARLEALGWKRPVYVRGALAEGPAVAIVGARAATQTAMDRAHHLAKHLTSRGVHVVSGGALGIDGAAHRGALAAGGTTTVVLGSGVDVLYPARHAPMFERALATGGALVSVFPDGMPPHRSTFPQRNPLIAALVDAVFVVEADVRSGSLATARAGAAFGRVIAAWPGSRGCDRLIASGAAVVENVGDAELALAGTPRTHEPEPLDPIATRVRDAIEAGAIGIDAIVRATGLAVRQVLRALPQIEESRNARKQ